MAQATETTKKLAREEAILRSFFPHYMDLVEAGQEEYAEFGMSWVHGGGRASDVSMAFAPRPRPDWFWIVRSLLKKQNRRADYDRCMANDDDDLPF